MSRFTSLRQVLGMLFFTLIGGVACANPITVDFSATSAHTIFGVGTENFTSQGVSFSTNCHYHLQGWLGFDPGAQTTCTSGVYNPNYLGPANVGLTAKMFVSVETGQKFDLTSFDFVRLMDGARGLLVTSSRGGVFEFSEVVESYAHFTLFGDDWKGLDWVVFSQYGPQPSVAGFDNLELNIIPEPSSTAAWVGVAGALLLTQRKRRTRAMS